MEPGQIIDWLIKGITGLITFMYLKTDKDLKDTRSKLFDYNNKTKLELKDLKSKMELTDQRHASDLIQFQSLFNLKIDQLAENMNTKIDEVNRAILHAEQNSVKAYDSIRLILEEYKKNK